MDFDQKLFFLNETYKPGELSLEIGDVLQVSELQLLPGEEIPLHTQWCDEITYIMSGCAYVYSDMCKNTLLKGGIHFLKSGSLHRIVAGKNEKLRFICIGYIKNNKNKVNKALSGLLGDKSFCTLYDDGTVKTLSNLLLKEFVRWDEFSKDALCSYISQIIAAMCRITKREKTEKKESSRRKINPSYATYKIMQYIDREYINIPSVKAVSVHVGYNECYVSHVFTEKTGISPKIYLQKKKLDHACDLLSSSNMSVEEIASFLCFSSAETFRRAFKKQTGKSPVEFRKQNLTCEKN